MREDARAENSRRRETSFVCKVCVLYTKQRRRAMLTFTCNFSWAAVLEIVRREQKYYAGGLAAIYPPVSILDWFGEEQGGGGDSNRD